MKLTILSQYYPPETGAPQARLSALAARFVARGHQVAVVTAMPNYPSGRIQDGYGGLWKRETRDGVSVLRTAIYPTQRVDTAHRLASYGSFAASSALLAPPFVGRTDYLMVESPPLFLGPSAWWLSRLGGARLIFNVSDLWPESAVRLGVLSEDSRAFRLAQALEAFCYRRAWLVTGQSRSIVADIADRFPGVPTFHFSNGVDTKTFAPWHASASLRRTLGADSEMLIVYAGLHGIAQGLAQVLDAAETLQRESRIRFVLVGDGPEKAALVAHAQQRGLENVSFLPSAPYADIPGLLASADVVLVPLKAHIPGAVPSKLYEAMASGRPAILIAADEAADVVRTHKAGIVVEPGDIQGLVRAIRALRDDNARAREAGVHGRAAAEAHFNRDAICSRFIDYLEANLEPARRVGARLEREPDAQADGRV